MNALTEGMSEELIRKYCVDGVYYTSYPALAQWSGKFTSKDYILALEALCQRDQNPLLLYAHFPFCAKQCYYCICNSIISTHHEHFQVLLKHIDKEIALISDIFSQHDVKPRIDMIHLGGGTPNLMNEEEFASLILSLKRIVDFDNLKEFAIEVDVRTTDKKKVLSYPKYGVTRLSFGIQDFDPAVQKAINRWQPVELIQGMLSDDLRKLYKGINFDIIYGLPLQTKESLKKTIKEVVRFSPDRITLLRYAHVPGKKAHQKAINEKDLPGSIDAEIFYKEAIDELLTNGYEYIGLNHFAKPNDELAIARNNHSLWRNFIGFTWGGPHDLLGIGPTSTSGVNTCYAQNNHGISEYYDFLDRGRLPILRGHKLTQDDLVRRDIINSLLCNASLEFSRIEKKYKVNFKQSFDKELKYLKGFIEDGFINVKDQAIVITPKGELFVRHICKVFDTYTQ